MLPLKWKKNVYIVLNCTQNASLKPMQTPSKISLKRWVWWIALYLRRISVAQSDWLIGLICTGFPHHLALLIIPLQTYLPHLQFARAQKATSKAQLLANSQQNILCNKLYLCFMFVHQIILFSVSRASETVKVFVGLQFRSHFVEFLPWLLENIAYLFQSTRGVILLGMCFIDFLFQSCSFSS